jgi:hypothetical protein
MILKSKLSNAAGGVILGLLLGYMGATSETVRGGYTSMLDNRGDCGYWRVDRATGVSTSPGLSGAVLNVLDSSTIGWRLDATNEYVYQTARVPAEFDGSADQAAVILVNVTLDAAETSGDEIRLEALLSYFGDHESATTPKTQTLQVAHNIGPFALQGDDHQIVMIPDHQLAGNVIEPGDKLTVRYRLYSVSTGAVVTGVNFISSELLMRSCGPARCTNAAAFVEG